LFAQPRLSAADRAGLLTGEPADPAADTGATVCACFGVGRNAIDAAIAQGCGDPAAIGRRLKAGTNCGSCVPELNRLITAAAFAAA
jgi:assimilatory nitrate reductase catalytic subunit